MNHRIILFAIMLCSILICAGCWDQVELNKRAIIVAIGIDKAEQAGEITLTLQSIIPSKLTFPMRGGGSQQGRAVRVVSASGKTVLEALRNYKQQTDNQPYLQENRLLVIGEDLAREGVGPVMDFFIRSPESKTRAWVLVSQGKARDILEWQSEIRQVPADFIDEMLKNRINIAPIAAEDIHQFILKLSSQSSAPTTSGIELVMQKKNLPPEVRIFGTAVFKKDKLAGWLDLEETRGLLWSIHQFDNGILETNLGGDRTRNVALQIIHSGVKIEPTRNKDKIAIKLAISADGNLSEQTGNVKLTDKKTIQSLEQKAAAVIRQEVESTLHKCQLEYNSDVFGFGEEIGRKFPKRWKALQSIWDKEFPRLRIQVVTKVKLKSTGIINDPVLIGG